MVKQNNFNSKKKLDISVIYPTKDRAELLMRSIKALLDSRMTPNEIVVVDQGETPQTQEALKTFGDPRIIHIKSDEKGLSRARNVGIEASQYAILGFLDDDCIPAKNWCHSVLNVIQKFPKSSVWLGIVFYNNSQNQGVHCLDLPLKEFSFKGKKNPWKIGPQGGNSIFRKSIFKKIGIFDPILGQGSDFPGAEDGDIIYRVLKQNFQVTSSNTIRCFHVGWRSDKEEILNGYNYGMGVGAMVAKFINQKDYYPLNVIFVQTFLSRFLAFPYNAISGRKNRAALHKQWCNGMIQGFLGWFKKKQNAEREK